MANTDQTTTARQQQIRRRRRRMLLLSYLALGQGAGLSALSGGLAYVVDDQGNFVVDDQGQYVIAET